MKFSQAIQVQESRTANGMKALNSSGDKVVDLFYSIGASRGENIIPQFVAALVDNTDWALRVSLWARDIRGGAGERKLFRDILTYLVQNDELKALAVLDKIGLIGRWDDLWSVFGLNKKVDNKIIETIVSELEKGNGLMAKWLPRQKEVINGKDLVKALRERMHLSPAAYRKFVVVNTNVVEQYMCQKNWGGINFSHVPSLAHSRYKKAFYKNAEDSYKSYVESLIKGTTKINASAVYPYDVLKGLISQRYNANFSKTELDALQAQWEALPNYLGDNSILAMVDVSGSMTCKAGGYKSKSIITCLDVAVSLGLYCADKLKGDFKDCFLTFSGTPKLLKLKGNIVQKIQQMDNSSWAMNTNLHKAMELILNTAIKGKVAQEDMPKTLVIFSDMMFDHCIKFDDSAFEMVKRKFENCGYNIPNIVFWNINHGGSTPVKFNKEGVALVSGFSPSTLRSILSAKSFTPKDIMLETIMQDRYSL